MIAAQYPSHLTPELQQQVLSQQRCPTCLELFSCSPPSAASSSLPDRRPRLLPCTHALCGSCVALLLPERPLCPFDHRPMHASSVEELPLHAALLTQLLVREQQQRQMQQLQQFQQQQQHQTSSLASVAAALAANPVAFPAASAVTVAAPSTPPSRPRTTPHAAAAASPALSSPSSAAMPALESATGFSPSVAASASAALNSSSSAAALNSSFEHDLDDDDDEANTSFDISASHGDMPHAGGSAAAALCGDPSAPGGLTGSASPAAAAHSTPGIPGVGASALFATSTPDGRRPGGRGSNRGRTIETMTPARKLLEVAALEAIGFESQPLTVEDLAHAVDGKHSPVLPIHVPLLQEWLLRMHMSHPELRRLAQQEGKLNEFTSSAGVQTLKEIYACKCGRIRFGQKQRSLTHIVSKHSAQAQASQVAKEQQAGWIAARKHHSALAAGAAGGVATGGEQGAAPADSVFSHAMLPAEVKSWQQQLLQGIVPPSPKAAFSAAPATAASATSAAAPATPSSLAGLPRVPPVPLLAPSSLDDAVPKAELFPPSAASAALPAVAPPASLQPPEPFVSSRPPALAQADDDDWAARGFVPVVPSADEWKRVSDPKRQATIALWLTRMQLVDWDRRARHDAWIAANPTEALRSRAAQLRDRTDVYGCKCRGLAWGKRSHAFHHISSTHGEQAKTSSILQQPAQWTAQHVAQIMAQAGLSSSAPAALSSADATAVTVAGVAASTTAAATAAADQPAVDESSCANCGRDGEDLQLLQCSACMSVVYCSTQCQRNHWKLHKERCKQVQTNKVAAAAAAPTSAAVAASAAAAPGAAASLPVPAALSSSLPKSFGATRSKNELVTLVSDLSEAQRIMQEGMRRMAKEMVQWRDEAQRLHKLKQVTQESDFIEFDTGGLEKQQQPSLQQQQQQLPAISTKEAETAAVPQAPAADAAVPVVKQEPAATAAASSSTAVADAPADPSASTSSSAVAAPPSDLLRAQNERLRSELSFLRSSHEALERRLAEWENTFGSMLPSTAWRMVQESRGAHAEEVRKQLTLEFQAKMRRVTDSLFGGGSGGGESGAETTSAAPATANAWSRPPVAAVSTSAPYAFAPASAPLPPVAAPAPVAAVSAPASATAAASNAPVHAATSAAPASSLPPPSRDEEEMKTGDGGVGSGVTGSKRPWSPPTSDDTSQVPPLLPPLESTDADEAKRRRLA